MEMAIIAGLILIVSIYYGFFDSAETAARMANRKIERLEAEQIAEDIKYYNEHSIDADTFKTAVAQKELLSSYRNM